MANKKSAKKQVLKSKKRQTINTARKTGIKTAMKKVLVALQEGKTEQEVQALFNDAQSKCSRASGKGVLHQKTAARKVSRLAAKVTAHAAKAGQVEQVIAKPKRKVVAKKKK